MALQVWAGKTRSGSPLCGPDIAKCQVVGLPGVAFSVDILASPPPPGGFDGYNVRIQYAGNIAIQDQTGNTENLWDDITDEATECSEPAESPGFYRLLCFKSTINPNSFDTELANVQFTCTGSGSITILGGAGDASTVSFFIDYPFNPFINVKGDSLQVNCTTPTATATPTSTPT
ncbi:MAG: hypothetical protein HY723_03725, partial [Chloroflexi bacterium]|nr:hypothetical protein [Chloroflexota bacterium]